MPLWGWRNPAPTSATSTAIGRRGISPGRNHRAHGGSSSHHGIRRKIVIGIRIGIRVRVRIRIRIRSALRVEGGIAAKDVAQIAGKVNEIGAGVDPTVKIGDGDHTGGVDMRVRALDDHVASGVDVDARGVARIGLHEPDDNGDVVGDIKVEHGDGAVRLKEVDGAAIVVGVGGGLGLEAGVVFGEGEEVLADEPFDVFSVWEC